MMDDILTEELAAAQYNKTGSTSVMYIFAFTWTCILLIEKMLFFNAAKIFKLLALWHEGSSVSSFKFGVNVEPKYLNLVVGALSSVFLGQIWIGDT